MFNYVGDISKLTHYIIKDFCLNKGLAVDATLGNGHDTIFLSTTFERVISMDIQSQAIDRYKETYNSSNVNLVCDSHANIDKYVSGGLDCVMYNLGYWPGGDKNITTLAHSSLESLQKSLQLLNPGGIISIALYVGHDEGLKEENFIMKFVEGLPKDTYGVMLHKYINRSEVSPRLIIIEKK